MQTRDEWAKIINILRKSDVIGVPKTSLWQTKRMPLNAKSMLITHLKQCF